MIKYEFSLLVEGPDLQEDEHLDRLYEAGLDDASFSSARGLTRVDVHREAATAIEAIISAIRQIESTVPHAEVIRIEPDDMVTLAEVARRTGRTQESIRLLADGRRGPGGFPSPFAVLNGRQRVWRWAEIARWFAVYEHADVDALPESTWAALAALNASLAHRHAIRLVDPSEASVVESIAGQGTAEG